MALDGQLWSAVGSPAKLWSAGEMRTAVVRRKRAMFLLLVTEKRWILQKETRSRREQAQMVEQMVHSGSTRWELPKWEDRPTGGTIAASLAGEVFLSVGEQRECQKHCNYSFSFAKPNPLSHILELVWFVLLISWLATKILWVQPSVSRRLEKPAHKWCTSVLATPRHKRSIFLVGGQLLAYTTFGVYLQIFWILNIPTVHCSKVCLPPKHTLKRCVTFSAWCCHCLFGSVPLPQLGTIGVLWVRDQLLGSHGVSCGPLGINPWQVVGCTMCCATSVLEDFNLDRSKGVQRNVVVLRLIRTVLHASC